MSLLQKASIITTPTAYAEDYLYSIKPAYALGSSLTSSPVNLSNDFNANGSSSITDADTFTSTGGSLDGIASKTSVFTLTVGRRFQIEIQGDTTSSGFTLGAGNGNGDEYGSGFGVHTFVSLHAQLWIRQRTSGTTNITKLTIQEVTDADFDFDRNSTGTRVNEDYLIEDVPYNFTTYSEDFNSWAQRQNVTLTENATLSPIGTGNATKILATSTSAKVRNNFTCQNGVTYTFSIYCKNIDATTMTLLIYDGSASYSVDKISEVSTDAWNRISISFTATQNSTSGQIQFARDLPNGESAFFWGAQLVKGNQPKDYLKTTDRLDIPRIDYTNGEPSILLEPSRTNLETKSNEFSTWGLVSNVTRTASYTQSPEGLNNATRLQFTANGFTASFTQSNSTQYTLSCYAKRNDKGTQNFGFFANGSGNVDSQFALTSTWQRFTYTYTSSNTSYAGLAGLSGADVSVYGMQIEAGSYATSLIHTSGSTVTRSADAVNNAGNSDLINSTEGVFYVEIKANSNDEAGRQITLSDGSTQNNIQIKYTTNDNRVDGVIKSGNVSQANLQLTLSTILEYHKVAVKYKANDCSFYVDGREIATDTSATMPIGMKQLNFDNGGGSNDFLGNFKMVAVFKEALTDLELEKLTGYNNHELYMNYYNRLSYLGLAEEYNVESDINNYIL